MIAGAVLPIDRESLHTCKTVRIGRIRADSKFDIVWSPEKPIRPVPFPIYRSRAQWGVFLNSLFEGWGGLWANPGPVEK